MSRKSTLMLAATLAAAGLTQGVLATEAAAPTPPEAPAPVSAPESPDAVIARMEARHQQMIEERERRYEELRAQASKLGFEMPEMPPWEPGERAGMPSRHYAPWITDEEREALRLKRWEETRARAAEHGVELPETPPWKAAEARRQDMKARFEKFRATMDSLSEEQRQSIEDLIGSMPEFGEMPEFGKRPAHPGYGMGYGWPGHKHCPHPGQPCSHGRSGYPMAPPAPDAETAPAN